MLPLRRRAREKLLSHVRLQCVSNAISTVVVRCRASMRTTVDMQAYALSREIGCGSGVYVSCKRWREAARAFPGDHHDNSQARFMDAGRLERLLRLRNQHSRQSAGAHGADALRPQDAR